MRKLSTRLYAILAAVFCAFVISCALPAQANTTPDDPVEAVVGFIQSIKAKDVSMVSYFDDATKNYFTQLICEAGDITDDEEIAAVRASLDDPDSIIVKKIAEEVGKNEKLSAQLQISMLIFSEKKPKPDLKTARPMSATKPAKLCSLKSMTDGSSLPNTL